jgi:nucleoside-diphosphate-sugar epimerase
LVNSGHEVLGLDTNLYQGSTFGQQPTTEDVPCLTKDIREVTLSDLEGIEAIIHLAGLSNDPLGDLNPRLTYEINHHASVELAKLAKKAGIERFIFASSCSNFGAAGDGLVDEEAEFNPVTPYGKSKVLVEQDVSKLADDNFSPTYLRSGTAYGVSPRLRFDLVLNNLVAWAFTTGKVLLKSDGTPWRPLVHVEDMSRAFLAALNAPRELVHNEAFNVGQTGENYQIKEIAQIVVETVPGSVLEFAVDAGPDKRNYRVNCDKIATILTEYKPQWTARKGACQLYEAYCNTGLSVEEFEGDRYRRINHIKYLIRSGRLDENLRWRN